MIDIVVHELDARGGTHKQVLRLCQYLKKNNIEFRLITIYYDESKGFEEFKEFDIVFIKKKRPSFDIKNRYLRAFFKQIYSLKEQFELFIKVKRLSKVINVQDYGLSIFILLCGIFGKKIVWQINDLPSCFLEGTEFNKKDNLYKFLSRIYYRFIIRYVEEITVNVTKNKERVKKCFKREAKVFYCGTDINLNLKKHKKIINKNVINLLSTGIFFPYRNYETLINVVESLIKNGQDCYLNIIGATDANILYTRKIKKLIDDKNLSNKIKIWGSVDENTFEEIYNKSDIFLFLNINQSWGLAVFEAIGAGLPTIVSESVGAVELLSKDMAIIVNPLNVKLTVDYIMKLKEDNYYALLSNVGIEKVKEYSWDNLYSKQMLEIFLNLELK